MIGTVWSLVIAVSGALSLALGVYVHSPTGIILGVCFTIMGVGIIWHEDRFARAARRTRR